jgi:two-component system, LytTR family, sensor kinase
VLFVASMLIIAYFVDPRPGFVKQENPGADLGYQLIGIVIFLLICFYTNMFLLVPRVLNKRGWWAYLMVAGSLVAAIVIIQLRFSVMDIDDSSNERVGRALVFLTLVTLSISTSIRLNSDRIKQQRIRKEQETESLKSELSLLRSQVTPHFMFNVLNTLASLARRKSDDLEDVIIQLSHLMRYMLYNDSGNKITIQQEEEFLKSYIEIQKLRFGEVGITEHWNTDKGDVRIESMLLIPLLENAFKHGTGTVPNPKIDIYLEATCTQVKFKVVNRFNPQLGASSGASGIGLNNVKKRLDYLYGDRHELTLVEEDDLFTAELTLVP